MSPIRVFVAIWIVYGIVATAGIAIMVAAVFLTWLWKRPLKGQR